jgi:hypothetical protein
MSCPIEDLSRHPTLTIVLTVLAGFQIREKLEPTPEDLMGTYHIPKALGVERRCIHTLVLYHAPGN